MKPTSTNNERKYKEPNGKLIACVRDKPIEGQQRGDPISGASVEVFSVDTQASPVKCSPIAPSRTTGEDGCVEFSLPAGSYQLTARALGYQENRSFSIECDQTTCVDLTIPLNFSLNIFTVEDGNFKPIGRHYCRTSNSGTRPAQCHLYGSQLSSFPPIRRRFVFATDIR